MDAKKALQEAVQALTKASKGKGEAAELARRVLPLLVEVTDAVEKLPGVMRLSQRAKSQIVYAVEARGQLETLAERRLTGNAQPFRCPRSVYDAVVAVFVDAERPLSMEEITSDVEQRLGERPADFQLRVPLRLWMHVQPPLITRSRARYASANRGSFKRAADAQWRRLR